MYAAHRSDWGLLNVLLVALLLGGCGGNERGADTADQSASAEADAEPESSPPDDPMEAAENSAEASLTPEDVGRWEKGLQGELDAVRRGREKLKNARNQQDSVHAMLEVQETAEAGAKAAGVEPERYQFIDSRLSDLASSLSSWIGSDTTRVEGAVGDEMRRMQEGAIQSASDKVPPEVVEAMKPRADELSRKSRELASEQLKVIELE